MTHRPDNKCKMVGRNSFRFTTLLICETTVQNRKKFPGGNVNEGEAGRYEMSVGEQIGGCESSYSERDFVSARIVLGRCAFSTRLV